MKKTILASLSAAVVGGLGFVGTASAEVFLGSGGAGFMTPSTATALRINDVGNVGHQLIIPYYTVQNNQSTAFSIVNTDRENGKAVKVRLRGAVNSDDVLDFQVYLSPGDVWAATLEQHSDGRMRIATVDNSCTLPRFSRVPGVNGQDKENNRLGYLVSSTDRVGGAGVEATREGYIEIMNMADILPGNANTSPAYFVTKHAGNGAPSCTNLNDIASRAILSDEEDARGQGFNTPTTGLSADWYILNLTQTTAFSGAAAAIEATVGLNGPAGRGNFIMFAQSNSVYAGAAGISTYTADPLFRDQDVGVDKDDDGILGVPSLALSLPIIRAQHYDLPDMSTPYLSNLNAAGATAPDATDPRLHAARLTALLRRTSVSNQYVVASPDFDTDWVFSLPSRRYSVALNYQASLNLPQLYRVFTSGILYDSTANPPVGIAGPDDTGAPAPVGGQGAFFHRGNSVLNRAIDPNQPRICVDTTDVVYWDREERSSGNFVVPSPGQPGTLSFCGETTVMRMGTQPVLGSAISTQTVSPPPATGNTPAFNQGWAWVGVNNSANGAQAGTPVLGYATIRARNNAANPVTNFGYTWPHRYNLPN